MARPSRFNNNPQQDHSSIPPAADTPQADPNPDNQPEPAPTAGPSRQQANSAVTGPTSALTSFLKEQGIRPRHVNRFAPRQQQASTSTSGLAIPEVNEETADQSSDSEPDSDDLDDRPVKKQKQKAPQKAASTATSTSEPSPKKKPDDDDEPPGPSKPKPGKYADRKPGLITTCAECGKRFTVTRHTARASSQQGQLCDDCTQEQAVNFKSHSKHDLILSTPAAKKRKTTKNQVVRQPWSESSIQSLQMACITLIARNTESIEELGYVGSVNLEKICQIVCKHRQLTPSNLALFVDAAHSDLKLFDCINLREQHLKSIAYFCPQLEKLTLNLCGHMTGDVLETYVEKLPRLREMELFGPYLVRKEAWLRAFEIWSKPRLIRHRALHGGVQEEMEGDDEADGEKVEFIQGPLVEGFRLKQSPRFDLACVKALVTSCPNLTSLRLIDIGLLDDQGLEVIASAGLAKLKDLSIANAGIHNGATGEALTDAGVVRSACAFYYSFLAVTRNDLIFSHSLSPNSLLQSVGASLERLDISQNKKLSDVALEAIRESCGQLTHLELNGLRELSTKGVQELFDKFKQSGAPGLKHLYLSRCIKIGNEALYSILDHSARTLKVLDLNSVDELRAEALERLATEAVNLECLDLSFVRDVDDFVIKSFLDHMQMLKSLSVYGNNRVSDLCPMKKGVSIKGQERSIVVT
ncbi:hypothetical protein VP01_376g7 [Puccinia sorghi]|uniref:DNA repair protein rhp7 treble clef domain-containing protein n=1 Tax=Puccinia sorghi TaxID=27349 RepID=A0A0L6UTP1_9BASI|nr:hypothetical protein VP01_376g7 [Puccinia sorghi]